jgi:predicted O-methyltransferase YrrM
MTQQRWSAVDDYLNDLLVGSDPALDAAQEAGDAAVAPNQGKLLHLLARIQGARAILEIGTLAGYSTIWLARALPDGGRLVTLEADPHHAELAAANLTRAGLDGVVDLRVGPALDTLPHLDGPFDLIFIDADKRSNPDYLAHALRLARPGSVIVADNTIRGGTVADPQASDPSAAGVRRFHELLAAEPRISATAIQTVGSKGHDGFTLALVMM